MKLTVFQPPYPQPATPEAAQACIDWIVGMLQSLAPEKQDLIVLPEYSNAPGLEDPQSVRDFADNEGDRFLKKVTQEARRLKCPIAAGTVTRSGSHWVNRTILFEPEGNEALFYDKIHLTDLEIDSLELETGTEVTVVEHDDIRMGFAVCFDMYFPEYFSALAAQNVDIIICPSYQRSESGERICLISQTRALDAGCYLVRSSYAIAGSETGGHSLVASPEGRLLATAGTEPGIIQVEIDPTRKFVKPRSHGQPLIEHRTLIERHRRPVLYRPETERELALLRSPFPRLCAHRGISHACPENTLPAFGAALSFGVHEIELDLWLTRDGVPVVCHDSRVDRTTDGEGLITEMEWTDIRQLDAGITFGGGWRGVRMPRFEEALEQIDRRAVLNIHIKDAGPDGLLVRQVCDLVRQYGLTQLAYIAGSSEAVLQEARNYDADIERACLKGQNTPSSQIELAQQLNCRRIQFGRVVGEEDIRKAHEAGFLCNLFYSDDPADAEEYVQKGIDVILTNCAHVLFASGLFAPAVADSANERFDEMSTEHP